MFTTFVKINVAKTPHNIPRGTPISPNISPSSIDYNTFKVHTK